MGQSIITRHSGERNNADNFNGLGISESDLPQPDNHTTIRVTSLQALPGRMLVIRQHDGTVDIRRLDPRVADGDERPLQLLRAVVRALKLGGGQ
jgi:hypothetical protein